MLAFLPDQVQDELREIGRPDTRRHRPAARSGVSHGVPEARGSKNGRELKNDGAYKRHIQERPVTNARITHIHRFGV